MTALQKLQVSVTLKRSIFSSFLTIFQGVGVKILLVDPAAGLPAKLGRV